MSRLPTTFTTVAGALIETPRKMAHRLERFSDRALDALQRNLLDVIAAAVLLPIGEGNLFVAESFTANVDHVIQHRLERAAVGYLVVSATAFARFKRSSQNVDLDARQITVQADATCSASVYVF